jgi:Carboxypeptidase regulatory-like domain
LNGAYGARSSSAAGTRLKLDAGQSLKDLVIKLTPQAMIFGKVIDDDGEPVPGTAVWAERYSFRNGKRELRPARLGQSQADGSFVIGNLAAGAVFLSAEMRSQPLFNQIEKAAGKSSPDQFLKTYFPNALDPLGASPIEVTAGAEVRGIEIHMRRGRMYEVRGHIQNTVSNALPDQANIVIVPKTDSQDFNPIHQTYLSAKNTAFQFKDLLPGTYVIQVFNASVGTIDASGESGASTQLTGRVEVSVGDADLENVIVPIGPGVDVAGSIKTEGDPPPATNQPTPAYEVFLQPNQSRPGYGGGFARASAEGNFRMHALAPGMYRVIVNGTPDGSYLKSIRCGDQDITGKDLDLTSGAACEIAVTISPNAADISGVVRNENGDAVSGAPVQAFLGDELKHTVNTDQNGAFHLTSLAPGDYRVFAFEEIESGLSQEPSFRKDLESRAASVKLEEKSHESLDLKVISKDEIEAAAAKVR